MNRFNLSPDEIKALIESAEKSKASLSMGCSVPGRINYHEVAKSLFPVEPMPKGAETSYMEISYIYPARHNWVAAGSGRRKLRFVCSDCEAVIWVRSPAGLPRIGSVSCVDDTLSRVHDS